MAKDTKCLNQNAFNKQLPPDRTKITGAAALALIKASLSFHRFVDIRLFRLRLRFQEIEGANSSQIAVRGTGKRKNVRRILVSKSRVRQTIIDDSKQIYNLASGAEDKSGRNPIPIFTKSTVNIIITTLACADDFKKPTGEQTVMKSF